MKRFGALGFICAFFLLGCGEYKPPTSALDSLPTPKPYQYQKAWEGSEKAYEEFQEADKILKAGADLEEFKKAYLLLSSAGKAGNLQAICAIASLNRTGYGGFFKKNLQNAVKYFKIAAEKGYPPAQHDLGSRYAMGEGVEQDHKEAFKWYQASADQGLVLGWIKLAQAYERGEGVNVDLKLAIQHYYLAALSNKPVAQYNLAVLVAKSDITSANKIDSHKWAIIAAANGYNNAVSLVKLQQPLLTKEEREYAEKWAKEWLEKKQN